MRGRLLLGPLALIALLCLAPAAFAGEDPAPTPEAKAPAPAPAPTPEAKTPTPEPDTTDRTYYSTKLMEDVYKNVQKRKDESLAEEKKKADANIKLWEDEYQKFTAPQEGKVEHNGKTINFKEPRRASEVEYKAPAPYKPWSLKADDFRFDLPVEVFEARPPVASIRDRAYVVLPYTVTNSLAEQKLLVPRITMITDGGAITPEVCGYLAHEAVETSTMTKRAWTAELVGSAREGAKLGALEPGKTTAGVAIFPRYDPGTTSVRFLIEGLADELNFKKNLRKAMVLEFVRPGNIYYPGQVKLAFKRRIGGKLVDPKEGYLPARDDDAHHGFDWVWLWNWESAVKVADAPKSSEVTTPTGAEKQKFWFFKLTIPNRTGEEQPMSIDRVATVIRLEILGKQVDVPFVDDGTLNVYKTEFFEKEGKPATAKRFPSDVKVGLGDENAVSFWVAFRESDFDFDAVCRSLANSFNLDLARERNKGGEKVPFDAVAGLAKFDAAKIEQTRKELLEKIPAALADQLAKRVVVDISAKSGLASGTRTATYSLYQPAFKIEKSPEAGPAGPRPARPEL